VLSHQAVVVWEWQVRWFIFSRAHLRLFRVNFTLPGRSSSALRHWDVFEYSEVSDSVHDRTWSNKKTADMDSLHYFPDDLSYRLGPVHRVRISMSKLRETGDWDLRTLLRSPGMGKGGDWWSWLMCVLATGIPRFCQFVVTPVSLGYPLSVFNKTSTLKPKSKCLTY